LIAMLKDLPPEKQAAILSRWIEAILATYPDQTATFLKQGQDRFTNPVGHTITRTVGALFAELSRGGDAAAMAPHLEDLIRVRAVQDFSPSLALSFVFALKPIVREELDPGTGGPPAAMALLEARIDDLALQAFDLYVASREKIYEIRVNEIKRRTAGLMKRMERVYGKFDTETE
jgi:hypothetical protein